MAQPQNRNPLEERMNYLRQAVKRSQELPVQAYQAGGATTFNFPHAGIGRYAKVSFTGTVSRTETAAVGTMVASPYYPFNLINQTVLNDYTGTTRVNAKAYHLFQRMLSRKFGFDPAIGSIDGLTSPFAASVWVATVPAGTASTTTTSPCIFSFDVPISLHPDTTEGSLPFAIPDGEVTLQLQMNALTGPNIDFPFTLTGATTCSIAGNWQVTYHYFDAPAGVKLPTLDFSAIHELVSTRQNTNIAAGQEKLFVLETGRTYYQLIHNFVANNALDTLDISRIKFLVDGNTPTMDEFQLSYLSRIREDYGRDLPAGMVLFNFFDRPWSPASYGSLATSLTLAAGTNLGAVYYLDTLKESMYFAKSALTA